MQVSSNHANLAAQQVAQSTERMNQLNQKITDSSQEISGKLLKVAVEDKLGAQQNAARLDLLA